MVEQRARRRAGRWAVGAVVGGALVLGAAPAGAGSPLPPPTFSADPTTIRVGETTTFTATGCTDPLVAPEDLVVLVSIGSDRSSATWGEAVPDAAGTAVFVSPTVEPGATAGDYQFGAACVDASGEVPETLFTYEQRVVVTVVVDPSPTTSTSVGPATVPARPAVASPRFTG